MEEMSREGAAAWLFELDGDFADVAMFVVAFLHNFVNLALSAFSVTCGLHHGEAIPTALVPELLVLTAA